MQKIASAALPPTVMDIAISGDSRIVVSFCTRRLSKPLLSRVDAGDRVAMYGISHTNAACWYMNDIFLVASSNMGRLLKIELNNGKLLPVASPFRNTVQDLQRIANSDKMIAGSYDGSMVVWDCATCKVIDKRFCAGFLSGNKQLYVSTNNHSIVGYDLQSGNELWENDLPESINRIHVLSDELFVVLLDSPMNGGNRRMQVALVDQKGIVQVIEDHAWSLSRIAGDQFVVGCDDGRIKLFKASVVKRTTILIATVQHGVSNITNCAVNGKMVCAVNAFGDIGVWSIGDAYR